MKNVLLVAMIAFLGLAFTNPTNSTSYAVNTAESKIVWKGYKVTGEHEGTIALKSGDLEFDDKGNLTGGAFVIDMTTLANTDLSGGMKGKLEGHLKSADFFGVENHPTANFKITKVVPRGTDGSYKIVGDLTIKNITKEIKFQADVKDDVATADIQIDRSDFDVRYGSGSFFDNLGDKTIYDEFDLVVTLKVNK